MQDFLCDVLTASFVISSGVRFVLGRWNNTTMATGFSLPDQAWIEQYKSELKNHNQEPCSVVRFDNKLWCVKKCEDNHARNRELLLYSLGRGLVNVAEIRALTSDEFAVVKEMVVLREGAVFQNTLMSRLVQDYSKDELPLKGLDDAVAGELVFSLWVRRRDAHDYNHWYTKEFLPVFYDLSASLDYGHERFNDVNIFFENHDCGYAGAWRVRERNGSFAVRGSSANCVHPIDSISGFKRAVGSVTRSIASRRFELKDLVENAGFTGADIETQVRFLETTKTSLYEDVSKMLQVVLPASE